MKKFKKERQKGNMSKKKKKALATASGLALITLLSGTFAWLNAQDQRVNRLESLAVSDGSVSVNEEFDPTPIQAGADAQKEVTVTNGGSSPVFVRVSFEEVLKHLKDDAKETEKSTVWTDAAASDSPALKAGVGRDMPVEFSSTKYDTWTDITSQITPVPTDVVVKAKGSYRLDPATNKEVQEFEYVMYAPLANGKNQKVVGDLVVDDMGPVPPTTTGTTVDKWKFSMDKASVKYMVYENGYDVNSINWALNTLADSDGNQTGAALLGTKGSRYGRDYDYRNQTNGGIIPDSNLHITPAALLPTYPTDTNTKIPIQADDKKLISLVFDGTNMLNPTDALATNKWVYNTEDGWFYYTGVLPTGQTTPKMLDKVSYSNQIDKEYSNATYDLVVKMEAVQAVEEALTDNTAGGFGLDKSGVSQKIIDTLVSSLP